MNFKSVLKALFWSGLGSGISFIIFSEVTSHWTSKFLLGPEPNFPAFELLATVSGPINSILFIVFVLSVVLLLMLGVGALIVKLALVLKRSP